MFTVHLWFLGYFMECFLESMNECSYKRKMEGWFVFMCPVLGLQIILEKFVEIIPENMRKKWKRDLEKEGDIDGKDIEPNLDEQGTDFNGNM